MKFKAHCFPAWGWLLALALATCVFGAPLDPCHPVATTAQKVGPIGDVQAVDYIYLVDTTRSMNTPVGGGPGTRWSELSKALLENVSQLRVGRGDRLHILFFGGPTMSKSLSWQEATGRKISVPNDGCSAWRFDLSSDEAKAAIVQSVRELKAPDGNGTPLFGAMRKGFETAVQLKAGGARKILIAVFSDGEELTEETYQNEARLEASRSDLQKLIDQSVASLGEVLVDGKYIFARVAGVNISPPTKNHVADLSRAPVFSDLWLMPREIAPGSLAQQESTKPVDVNFIAQNTDGAPFEIRFEQPAGSPRVEVVCADCGKPPVWKDSGPHRVIFRRRDAAVAFMNPFEGRLRINTTTFDTQGGSRRINNYSSEGTLVRFEGARTEDIPDSEVKPANGTRVLMGSVVLFSAPERSGAKYSWRLSGAESATSERSRFERMLPKAGFLDVELSLEQPGIKLRPRKIRLEVVDPGLSLTPSVTNPVVGETLTVTLSSSPGVAVRGVQWIPSPVSGETGSARYVFDQPGAKPVSAVVATELGEVITRLELPVGPGVDMPALVSPQAVLVPGSAPLVELYRTTDPVEFVAEVGPGVGAVRFEFSQPGSSPVGFDVSVRTEDGRPLAKAKFSPVTLKPGKAALRLIATAADPAIARRVGSMEKDYAINVNRSPVSITRLEPLSSELKWGRPVTFSAAVGGSEKGLESVTEVEWTINVVEPGGGRTALPGVSQKKSDWLGGKVSNFTFTPEADNPRLRALKADASLEVTARPVGDPANVEGLRAVWSGLSPKFAPARFVIELPQKAILDEKMKLRVVDELGGAIPISVRWELVGETADPLRGQSGSEQEFVPQQPGPHTVRAVVEWAGGSQACPEQSFYVDYEPAVVSDLTWDGGREPVVTGRGRLVEEVVKVRGVVSGSRIAIELDLSDAITGRPVYGYPKQVRSEELKQGVGLEFPAAIRGKVVEYSAAIKVSGLDTQGRPTDLSPTKFRLINRAKIPDGLKLAALSIFLLAAVIILWASWNNETRFLALMVATDSSRIGAAVSTVRSMRAAFAGHQRPKIFQGTLNQVLSKEGGAAGNIIWISESVYWTFWSYFSFSKSYRIPLFRLGAVRAFTSESAPAWVAEVSRSTSDGGTLEVIRKGSKAQLLDKVYRGASGKAVDEKIQVGHISSLRQKEFSNLPNSDIVTSVYKVWREGAGGFWVLTWDCSDHADARRWLFTRKCMGVLAVIALAAASLLLWEYFIV
jgi:hypothetical protein